MGVPTLPQNQRAACGQVRLCAGTNPATIPLVGMAGNTNRAALPVAIAIYVRWRANHSMSGANWPWWKPGWFWIETWYAEFYLPALPAGAQMNCARYRHVASSGAVQSRVGNMPRVNRMTWTLPAFRRSPYTR